jgi:thiol-disulfide isomerase/thioredoxin
VRGYPSLFVYEPKNDTFYEYTNDRTAQSMSKCTSLHECKGAEWPSRPAVTLRSHGDADLREAVGSPDLQLCKTHPTVIVFSGVLWCGHCQDSQPFFEKMEEESQGNLHLKQYDWNGEEGMMPAMMKQFGIESFPTVLVFDPRSPNPMLQQYQSPIDSDTTASILNDTYTRSAWTGTQVRPSLVKCDNTIRHPVIDTVVREKEDLLSAACDDMSQISVHVVDVDALLERLSDIQRKSRSSQKHHDENDEEHVRARLQRLESMLNIHQQQQQSNECDPAVQDCAQRVEREKQANNGPVELTLCDQCITVLCFTQPASECPPCQAFKNAVEQVLSQSSEVHVKMFENSYYSAMPNVQMQKMFECFAIQHVPTMIVYDPNSRAFCNYQGAIDLQQIKSRAGCGGQFSPFGLHLELKPCTKTSDGMCNTVKNNSNGMKRKSLERGRTILCAQHPTVLVFTMGDGMEFNEQIQPADPNLHVVVYNSATEGQAIDMYGIKKFPTVLLFDPNMYAFYKYDSRDLSTNAISNAFRNASNMQEWETHPLVVLKDL